MTTTFGDLCDFLREPLKLADVVAERRKKAEAAKVMNVDNVALTGNGVLLETLRQSHKDFRFFLPRESEVVNINIILL